VRRLTDRVGVLLLALLLVGGVGCVMPDQLSQMQKDLADVRQQLSRMEREQQDALAKLSELETRAGEDEPLTRAELADVSLRIDQASRDVSIVDERMNDMALRIDRLADEVNQSRMTADRARPPLDTTEPDPPAAGGALPGTNPADALPDPEALYNTAYADFSKGNYALAISGFEEYVEKFPDSATADNAQYWIGECHFSQGNFAEGIRAFDMLLETHPDSDKAAAGNLKKALAFLEQNQIGQAIVQLRFVSEEYPNSDEAKIARDKLTSLGAPI